MTHLSRISEEIILWMSQQFNFISLPDRFCTGSSIMPQKKNPDIPELIRGKSGRVNGNLMALLTLAKSQPLAYNKDNQEDKEPIFDTVETVLNSLIIFNQMIPGIKPNIKKMRESASIGHSTATDLAEYLGKRGIAFRDAHHAVGGIVAFAIEKNSKIDKMFVCAYIFLVFISLSNCHYSNTNARNVGDFFLMVKIYEGHHTN